MHTARDEAAALAAQAVAAAAEQLAAEQHAAQSRDLSDLLSKQVAAAQRAATRERTGAERAGGKAIGEHADLLTAIVAETPPGLPPLASMVMARLWLHMGARYGTKLDKHGQQVETTVPVAGSGSGAMALAAEDRTFYQLWELHAAVAGDDTGVGLLPGLEADGIGYGHPIHRRALALEVRCWRALLRRAAQLAGEDPASDLDHDRGEQP
jgi:hypothetical protein